MTYRNPGHTAVAIVDEEIGRLALLTRIVEEAGYIAVPAYSGERALKLFDMIRPELAVIHADLTAGITAAELCAEFSDPPNSVPVVVIAYEPKPWFSCREQRLVSDYLILPFTAHQLIQVIQKWLNPRAGAPAEELRPTDLVS